MRVAMLLLMLFSGVADAASCLVAIDTAPAGPMGVGDSNGVRIPTVLSPSSVSAVNCIYGVVLSAAEYEQLQGVLSRVSLLEQASGGSSATDSQPFDYVKAAAIFSFFFSFTVGCWYVAKHLGLFIDAVKRW